MQQGHVLHDVLFVQRGLVDISVGVTGVRRTGGTGDDAEADDPQYHVLEAPACLLETLGQDDCLAELALLPVPQLGKDVSALQGARLSSWTTLPFRSLPFPPPPPAVPLSANARGFLPACLCLPAVASRCLAPPVVAAPASQAAASPPSG